MISNSKIIFLRINVALGFHEDLQHNPKHSQGGRADSNLALRASIFAGNLLRTSLEALPLRWHQMRAAWFHQSGRCGQRRWSSQGMMSRSHCGLVSSRDCRWSTMTCCSCWSPRFLASRFLVFFHLCWQILLHGCYCDCHVSMMMAHGDWVIHWQDDDEPELSVFKVCSNSQLLLLQRKHNWPRKMQALAKAKGKAKVALTLGSQLKCKRKPAVCIDPFFQ